MTQHPAPVCASNIMLYPLFATPVIKTQLAYQPSARELDHVLGLDMTSNVGNRISRDHGVLSHHLMRPLSLALTELIDRYVSMIYATGPEVRLCLTQSWINSSDPGQWHHAHRHPNSVVSGVYYVRAQGDHYIRFLRKAYQQIELVAAAQTEWTRDHSDIPVVTGDCVLFPSELHHEVLPVPGTEPRITLSFNTFPVGVLGDHDNRAGVRIDGVGHAAMMSY